MTANFYRAEGLDKDIKKHCLQSLCEAKETGKIIEGKVVRCDENLNLTVNLGNGIYGTIPYGESELSKGKSIKKISVISKVGKTICFKVTDIDKTDLRNIQVTLSRKAAQEEYENYIDNNFRYGDIIDAKVIHSESYGSFIDIGCGLVALLTADDICLSKVKDARTVLKAGDVLKVAIKLIENGRITVTQKELLGTWKENIEFYGFTNGATVIGRVMSVTPFGIFVELTSNLSGLAELKEGIKEGDDVSVYIKNIYPERMKVKLSIIDKSEYPYERPARKYFITEGHMDNWVYSPAESDKNVKTVFIEESVKNDTEV